MASGGTSPPKDAQWISISANPLEIQKCGMFAVATQQAFPGLQLNAVEKSWQIILASGYGHLYLLVIQASPPEEKPRMYEAIVWVKVQEYYPMKLVSFR